MDPNCDHKLVAEKCSTEETLGSNVVEIKTFHENFGKDHVMHEPVESDPGNLLRQESSNIVPATVNFAELVSLMQKELTCLMCQEIMKKPCVCPTCGNLVGCKQCLDQSHVSLNEFRDSNDYEPVDPMCPYCRESSYPFRPVEFKAMQEVASLLKQWSLKND